MTAVFVVASNKDFEQRITIKEDYIEFDAVLYDKVKFEDIRTITYIDNDNFKGIKDGKGATTHRYFSGECNVDEIGKCRAYIYYKNTSFIVLESDKTILFKNKIARYVLSIL